MPRETFTLYGGQVTLRFDGRSHRYHVIDRTLPSGETPFEVPSVTQINKTIDKGEGLIQWAANCCRDYFLSVTEPGIPFDEADILRIADKMRFAYRDIKKEKADLGTIVHNWLHQYVQAWKRDEHAFLDLPQNPQARARCEEVLKWMDKVNFEPGDSERMIYSRKYGFAGRFDDTCGLANIGSRRAIVDWKNSKYLYDEYRFQTAAYQQAMIEEDEIVFGSQAPMIRQEYPQYTRWVVRIAEDMTESVNFPDEEFSKDIAAFVGMIPTYWRLYELRREAREKAKFFEGM